VKGVYYEAFQDLHPDAANALKQRLAILELNPEMLHNRPPSPPPTKPKKKKGHNKKQKD